jgi:hypothetical protein
MNKLAAAASSRLPPVALDEEAEALRCRSNLESDPLLMHGAAVLVVALGGHSNHHSSGRYLAVPLQFVVCLAASRAPPQPPLFSGSRLRVREGVTVVVGGDGLILLLCGPVCMSCCTGVNNQRRCSSQSIPIKKCIYTKRIPESPGKIERKLEHR